MTNITQNPCDEGVIRCGRAVDPCTRIAAPWILTATILASSMAIIDSTAVNVALPVLQAEFGAGVVEMQWIVEAYALFLSALLLVGGALGDQFGRRKVFMAGVLLFAAASIGCGLAPEAAHLIVARGLQGIGGALLMPGSLAILSASFDEERRGRAIGTWSGATAMAAALGPVLGGWLVENVSWRWIFFINLPLAISVIAISIRCVPESRDREKTPGLDWAGALLATLSLAGLVFGLLESGHLGLSHPAVAGALVVGALAFVAFLVTEARARAPMMPLHLFRSRVFAGANLLTLFLYAALGGGLFFLPFNLIQVQGYKPTQAGAAILPFIMVLSLLSRWSGGLVARRGARLPLVAGPLIAGAGYALLALPGVGGVYWITFFPGVLVLGLGMAISVAPLTTTVMGALDVRYAGVASGINNAMARTSGLLAVAVLGVIALASFGAGLRSRVNGLELPPEALIHLDEQNVRLAAAEVPGGLDEAQTAGVERAIDESFVGAFRLMMLVSTGLALMAALSAAMALSPDGPAGATRSRGGSG